MRTHLDVSIHMWSRPAGLPILRRALPFLPVLLTLAPTLCAQQAEAPLAANSPTIQELLQRIADLELKVKKVDQLEARVKQLEGEKQLATSPQPAASPSSAAAATPVPAQTAVATLEAAPTAVQTATPPQKEKEADQQTDHTVTERMDMSNTLLRIRGFGDINLHGDTQRGNTTSFSLGQLNLFVTSDISEKFKFLSEIIFEGGPDNIYGVTTGEKNAFTIDVERYLIEYSFSDYFKLAAGRWHTAIGYYNTAYHHSTWFQTTTDRPFLFFFEDRGGILPIHTVGVSASGLIPSGRWGLHYVAEVGNGRASRTPLTEEPVQNEIDEENHKAYNLAIFARPEAVRGLQVGFSFYQDDLAPANAPKVNEKILASHAVLVRKGYEWLNEALLVRHAIFGTTRTYNTPGFYSQVSKQFGSLRPYIRYQYLNSSNTEPIFPDVGLRQGPSIGLRYDASEFVALKFQYDYTALRQQAAVNALGLQIGFTF